MICPSCGAANETSLDACIACGKGLFALTRGARLSGRYEVLDALGRGGMGVVYKARDLDLDEVVALKVLRADLVASPDLVRRFRSEIKLARRVSHPNVCRIHDYGREGHVAYIVMELVEGTNLRDELRRRGRLAPAEALDVAMEVAAGLAAVHAAGVVHRDLKTPNVMRTAAGVVKLMDFGIAKSLASDQTAGATATGQVVGTPEYMSPEQARGERLDERSDLYSLGVMLFELLTGEVPFRGDTPMATLLMHLGRPPLESPAAARLPPATLPLLRRALEKAPADRPPSARAFLDELRAAREALGEGDAARGETARGPAADAGPPRATEALSRSRLAAAGAPTETTPVPTPVPASRPRAGEARPGTAPTSAMPPGGRSAGDRPVAGAGAAPGPEPSVRRHAPRAHVPLAILALGGAIVAGFGIGAWLLGLGGDAGAVTEQPLPSPATAARTAEAWAAASPVPGPAADPGPGAEASGSPGPVRASVRGGETADPPSPGPSPRAASTPLPQLARPDEAVRPTPRPAPVRVVAASPPPAAAPSPLPSPATVAAEGRGLLQIGVRPYADVTIDGTPRGQTPLRPLSLEAGTHEVRLEHPGYVPMVRTVVVRPGETTKLVVDLKQDGRPR